MDKITALNILIDNSVVLSLDAKDRLKKMIDKMTPEEIDEWGKTLSAEQDYIEKNYEKIMAKLNSLVE
ncbi:MAG TPA: hypothetical protein PK370_02690 [Candidatus Woesebacteria bacterium]|nr:hypothetical protein [Candidatus Woesebacteria bacterium]HPJ17276.1 hypothetical protein [Candidatus Woesebacteria bacterium]